MRFPFLSISNSEKPSYFELEILLNGKYYSYGFEVILSKSKFISEWLVELHSDNTESILFARDIEKGKYDLKGFDKSASKNKLKVYAEDISEDSSVLFLSIMNQNKRNFYKTDDYATILKDVFLWIQNKLDINFPNQPISNYSYLLKADKVNGINEICRIISAFGTGITNLQMIEVPFERVLRNLPKELQNKIKSDIEQKQVEIRENKKIKKDFFI